MTKAKLIAQALEDIRLANREDKYTRAGSGCPFHHLTTRMNICMDACGTLFPKWKERVGYLDGYLSATLKHPCIRLDQRYVVKRCREFVRKHL